MAGANGHILEIDLTFRIDTCHTAWPPFVVISASLKERVAGQSLEMKWRWFHILRIVTVNPRGYDNVAKLAWTHMIRGILVRDSQVHYRIVQLLCHVSFSRFFPFPFLLSIPLPLPLLIIREKWVLLSTNNFNQIRILPHP